MSAFTRIFSTAWILGWATAATLPAETPPADVLTPAEREQFFQSYFDRMTAPKPLARFRTKAEWVSYRRTLREQVLRSLGLSPLPERVPLAPRITGRIERDDYVIERVYYQVLPQVYASGYLYTPKSVLASSGAKPRRTARLPAILNPHGHWGLGAVHPIVQSRCIAEAKLGYVAFCPDSTHELDFGTGLCPIGLMTWNNMRALDYLASLPFVDASRLACTGESGGGQQTMYLAALDERVKVIVPAVLVSYFRRILFVSEEAHCFCNHAPGIERVTDETELAAMFAPRPARFICATGDWTRDFPKAEFPEIQHLYRLMGGEVDCVQFDKPHNYDRDSREQMYPWMNRYLKGNRDPAAGKEPNLVTEDPAALRALSPTNATIPGLAGAGAFYRSNYLFRPPDLRSAAAWRTYLKHLQADLRDVLGEDMPPVPLNARSRGTAEVGGFKVEKVLLDTEPAVSVPAWLLLPEKRSGRAAGVVIAHPGGKAALLAERAALVRALIDTGVVVLAVDPRMRGELRRNWFWNEIIWGRPETGMAAHDLNCAGEYLRSRPDVDPDRVSVLGLGDMGTFALCAAALDSRWAGAALEAVGPLYAEMSTTNALPNVLRHGDLPQFAALVAPRALWLNGAGARFQFTAKGYATAGRPAQLRCTDLAGGEFDAAFPQWLAGTSSRTAKPRR